MNFDISKISYLLLALLFGLLFYAGYLSQKSIDWDVLKKMEAQKLILPTQIPQPSASISTTPTK